MKKVAIIILNWNGKDFLQKFLPSVLEGCATFNKIGLYKATTIVADNGSTDSSKEIFEDILHNYSEQAYWIGLDKNYGFTGGYNRAIEKIATQQDTPFDYYILLNSDIYTPKDWLFPLISFMEYYPKVGVCAPKILSYTQYEKLTDIHSPSNKNKDENIDVEKMDNQFEYAGASGGYIDKYGFPFCRGRILSCIEDDLGQYNTPLRTFWATGACMVVRRELWEKLRGLDESFFAHMEEIDFCWRAALLGNEIWCVPQSYVFHVGGGTLPNNSPSKLFYNYRNNLLMLKKNLDPQKGSRKIFVRKLIDGASAIIYLLQGKWRFAQSVIKAHRAYDKMKKNLTPSPRVTNSVYGIYNRSIILKFFTGTKRFSQIRFSHNLFDQN